MHTGTGEIIDLEELKKKPIKEQRFYKEIPQPLEKKLQSMNRKQRREFYRRNKHLFKKSK